MSHRSLSAHLRLAVRLTVRDIYSRWQAAEVRSASGRPLTIEMLEQRQLLSSVALLNFNEGSGTSATDSSGNGNSAALVGAATFAAGKEGSALSIPGSGEADIPDASSLDGASQLSLSAWVNATTWNSNGRIIEKSDANTDDGYALTVQGGQLEFLVSGVGNVTAPVPSAANWHYISGTYDGSALDLYVDGTQVGTTSASGSISPGTGPLVIGNQPGNTSGADEFNGLIDDVEVDNTGLSATQIAQNAGQTGWTDLDIGSPAQAGSATFDGTTWTVTGGGSDIYGPTDQFNFASQSLVGNGSIVAKIDSQTNSSSAAKAGVMIRADNTAGAYYAAVFVRPDGNLDFQWRNADQPDTDGGGIGGISTPVWVKLTRLGDTFTGYYSTDGATWTELGSQSVAMSNSALAGLAVTAENNGAVSTVAFTHVAVTPSTLPAGWNDSDIGSPGQPGTASYDGTTWTVAGGGSDIYGATDQFNFASQSLDGNGSIIAEVDSQTETSSAAKAGVMIRADDTAGAYYAAVVVRPDGNLDFQWRNADQPDTDGTGIGGITAPVWVKLTRFGNTFTGYYSTDGSTWTDLGSQTIAMGNSALAGLAVTAENNSALSTVTFTNVAVAAASLPAGWTDSDIGSPGQPGTASYDGTTWTVVGGGSDIYGSSDQFNYASQSLAGNGSIVAKIDSQSESSSAAKAGVMIRADGTDSADYAAVILRPDGYLDLQWRNAAQPDTDGTGISGITAPVWVKLTRLGDSFTGYYSTDGTTWTQLGSTLSISMGNSVLAGLAVTAENNSTVSNVTFTNVAVTAAASVPSPWSDTDIGTASGAGGASFDGSTYSVASAGALAGDQNGYTYQGATSDSFNYVYQPLGSNQQIVTEVTQDNDTTSLAKAGLMIRDSSDPDSAFAGIFATPGWGAVMLDRSTAGANAQSPAYNSSYNAANGPLWLKLTDQDGVITGFVSTDDSTWSQIGQVTVGLGSTPSVGLAVDGDTSNMFNVANFANTTLSAITSALVVPQAPFDLSTDSFSGSDGRVVWKPMSGADSFTIQQSTDGGSTFQTVATVPGSADTYLPDGLTPSTDYLYRVQDTAGGVTSAWSSPIALNTSSDSASGNYSIALGSTQYMPNYYSDSVSVQATGQSVEASSWEQALLLGASGTATNNSFGNSYTLGNFTALSSGSGFYGNSFGFVIVQDPYVAFNNTAGTLGSGQGQTDTKTNVDWVRFSLELDDQDDTSNTLKQAGVGPGNFDLIADSSGASNFIFSVTNVTYGGSDWAASSPQFNWQITGTSASPSSGNVSGGASQSVTLTAPGGGEFVLSVSAVPPSGATSAGSGTSTTVDIHVLPEMSITASIDGDLADPAIASGDEASEDTTADNVVSVPSGAGTLFFDANGLSTSNSSILSQLKWTVVANPTPSEATPTVAQLPNNPNFANVSMNAIGSFDVIFYWDMNSNGQYDSGEELGIFHLAEVGMTPLQQTDLPGTNTFQAPTTFENNNGTYGSDFASGSSENPAITWNDEVQIVGGGSDGTVGADQMYPGLIQNVVGTGVTGTYEDGKTATWTQPTLPVLDTSPNLANQAYSGYQVYLSGKPFSREQDANIGQDLSIYGEDYPSVPYNAEDSALSPLKSVTGLWSSFKTVLADYSSKFPHFFQPYSNEVTWGASFDYNVVNGAWNSSGSEISFSSQNISPADSMSSLGFVTTGPTANQSGTLK